MFIQNWKKELFTIPNLLSLFRLVLLPIYARIYLNATEEYEYMIAGSIMAVSCLTDLVDGKIARKFNQITNLGKVLDPFADKLTQGVIMLCLTIRHREILPLLLFFVLKEGFMFVMGCRLLRQKKILDGALMTGKVCTTVLFLGMIALVVFPAMPPAGVMGIVLICAVFMLISLVSYILCYVRHSAHIKDLT